ncbi:MAG: cytochrome c oxidase subunit 3 family protein [Acidobacteriota bacterium]
MADLAHSGGVHEAHHPKLQHHFEDLDQQREASTLGMWLFLVTEIMFFGGLFCAYLIYRGASFDAFAEASRSLDLYLGGFNTAVLIGSSLTMALAVWAAQVSKRKALIVFMILTIVLGAVFLGVKVIEYSGKFAHHHVPGDSFEWAPPYGDPANEAGTEMFFSLYFAMTGLHAAHMIIGMGFLAYLLIPAWQGKFNADWYNPVECFGLYWHFVDIVWIFLFPLLYLIGRH